MNNRKIYTGLFLLSFLHLLMWNLYLQMQSDFVKVQYIPDDGFYYLTLAKNFIKYSYWTFDSGITKTSGFHLLYAYVLVSILNTFGDHNFLNNALAVSWFFIFVLYGLIWRIYKKYQSENILIVCSLLLSSINVFYNSVSIIEWNLVVLLTFLYLCFSFQLIQIKGRLNGVLIGLLGLFATLARTEFIFICIVVLAVQYWFAVKTVGNQSRELSIDLLYGVLGGLIGVGVIAIHNYWYTSELLQSSASIKYYWSSKEGHTPMPFIYQCLKLFISIPRLRLDWWVRQEIFKYLLIFSACIIPFVLVYKRRAIVAQLTQFRTDRKWFIIVSNSTIIALYTIFYSFNAVGIQTWYTGLVISSIGILAYYLVEGYFSRYAIFNRIMVITVFINIAVCWYSSPFYQSQKDFILIGKYVNEKLTGLQTAAWDSGIMGFYSGGRVINVDGLVNNEVGPYIKGDSLRAYIYKRQIYCLLQDPRSKRNIYGLSAEDIQNHFTCQQVTFDGQKINLYFTNSTIKQYDEKQKADYSK